MKLLCPIAALLVGMSMAAAGVRAQSVDQDLATVDRAYRADNFRLAAGRLNELAKSVDQFLPHERLTYWDLCANVAQASGLPARAERAAITHLALLRQASAIPQYERYNLERRALVRLAQLKRAVSGAEDFEDTRDATAVAALRESCSLYRQALQIPRTIENEEQLWEAETRCELAQTLDRLRRSDEAREQYAAASRSAEAALGKLAAAENGTDEFLRGAVLVQRAFLRGDEAAAVRKSERRQAERALGLLEDRLRADNVSPSARGKLLPAIAACYRQMQDSGRERQVLERLLQEAGTAKVAEVEQLTRAEVSIRLAELTDSAPPHLESSRPESDRLYREAATLCAAYLAKNEKPVRAETAARLEQAGERSIGKQNECRVQLQIIYTRLEEWEKAIAVTERLLEHRKTFLLAKADPNYFRTLSALGSLHAKKARAARVPAVGVEQGVVVKRDDVRLARQYLAEALAFWRTYKPQSPADLATTLNHYAEVVRYDGDFRQADALLRELGNVVKSHSVYGEHDLRLAEFYTNRAAVQAALGQFFLALANYREAEKIGLMNGSVDIRERRQLLAMIYLNEAQLHKSQRQLAEARSACEKALEVASARDAGLSQHELVPFQLANASLLIAEAEQDYARPPSEQSDAELTPGKTPDADVRYKLEQAIEITRPIAEPTDAQPTALEMANALHLQALAHYRLHEYCGGDEAERQAAERLWVRIVADETQDIPQFVILRIRAWNYLVAIGLGDLATLRREALNRSRVDGSHDDNIASLVTASNVRLEQANQWSQRGEIAARQMLAYPAIRVQALLARAQVLRADAQIHRAKAAALGISNHPADAARETRQATVATDEAIEVLEEAVETVELPRTMTVGAEEQRAEYFAQFAPVFDLLIDLLVENGRHFEAIQTAEKRRSRTFQDQLRTSGIDLYRSADKNLVDAVQRARDAYYTTLTQLNENWSDRQQRDQLSQELVERRRTLVAAEQEIKSSNLAARQLLIEGEQAGGKPASIDEKAWIVDTIGDDAMALVYYIGAEKSYLFAFGGKFGIVCRRLSVSAEQAQRRGLRAPSSNGGERIDRPLRADDVVKLVADVRTGVEQLPVENRRNVGAIRGSQGLRLAFSSKVGPESDYIVTDMLLPPDVRRQVVEARPSHLIVVPDGALHQLPLELLPEEADRKRYLFDILPPISYAPSLHIHRTLQGDTGFGKWQVALLSLADPRYREAQHDVDENERGELSSAGREFVHYWGGGLQRLAGFREESDAVCAAFQRLGNSRGEIVQLVDSRASETELKKALQHRRIGFLHVAAHGLVSQQYNNLFGAIALAPPDRPTEFNDGFLSLHEVFSLPLAGCELAVLSACETNCGTESPLEAGSTMARAFICAGAKRVVCSHWGVADDPTKELVSDYMRRVGGDLSAGRPVDFAMALYAAKKRLRENPDTELPYFWAPFVLIGPPSGGIATEPSKAVASQGD